MLYYNSKFLVQYCLLWRGMPGRQGSRGSEKLPITVVSRFANSIGPSRGLQALSRAKALSHTRFPVGRFIHPSGICLLISFSKAGCRSLPLTWPLIAQLPQQLHGASRRPWLVGVDAAQAGDPIARGRVAADVPDHSRHGSPPPGITTSSSASTASSRAESPALASASWTQRLTR